MSRALKLIISIIFFSFTIAAEKIKKIFGKTVKGTLVVLTYHTVPDNGLEIFEKQMAQLLKTGKPVFADIKSPLPYGMHFIAVTFDDGFVSVGENALPILQKKNIPVTLFIPAGCLGIRPLWVKNDNHIFSKETVMSADQVRKLPKELIKFGSHCMSHPKITKLDIEQAKIELFDSRRSLGDILSYEINMLSFPYDDYNNHIVELAKKAGYSRVFSNTPIFPISKIDTFLMGRILVTMDDWGIEYWLKIRGAYQWLGPALKIKRKLKSIFSPVIST